MKRKAPKESTLKGKGLSMPFPLKYPLSPNDQRSVTFGNPILLFFYLSLFLSSLLIIDSVVNYSLSEKTDNRIKKLVDCAEISAGKLYFRLLH